ncbi:MAG: SBBP repeat-containing protein [Bacteroidota bacterium]
MKLKTIILPVFIALAAFAFLPSNTAGEKLPNTFIVPENLPAEPFRLVENRGQWIAASQSGALLAVSTPLNNARLFVFQRGLSLVYYGTPQESPTPNGDQPPAPQRAELEAYRVDIRFDGSSAGRTLLTGGQSEMQHWYLPGSTAGNEDISLFSGVTFTELYPGIDLVCRLEKDGVKYEFVVRPGADPSRIAMRIDGAGDPQLQSDGGLMFQHTAGTLSDRAPFVYQHAEGGGREVLQSHWSLENGAQSIYVVGRDPSRTLIIDPFLQWSTFLGGKLSDYARDVAIDKQGTMFICGYTASSDFPVTPGALQGNPKGSFEVFVSAFSRERRLLWSTYFGGSASEENPQIAIGQNGELYVSGSTSSIDLPVTPDALQPRNGGRYDVFLLALDDKGRRRWATYFGGSYSDECGDIAVGPDGSVYITGGTYSTNFPVTPDAIQTSNNGDYDIFLARFSAKGIREWATYIGGWSMDYGAALAIDKGGDIYIAGRTESTNLPAITLERQSAYGGGSFDGFVMRIDGRMRKIRWSTYLGGEQEESVERLALDSEGNIVLTGYTASTQFPLAGNTLQKRQGGLIDAFVASMDPNGALRWCGYLGGVEVDKANGIAIDKHDNILISGFTGSRNFPLAGKSILDRKGGGYDVFITQFSPGGGYLWGSFYGGETHDISYGLGMDPQGNAVVVGGTESKGFRTAGNIYQGDLSGLTDAFVLRIIFNEPIAFAGPDTTICRDGNTKLGGEANGGTPPYKYEWSPTASLSNPLDARPVASPRVTTAYVLTVTDAEGAIITDTVIVTVAQPPIVEAGIDRSVCPESSVVLQSRVEGGRGPYRFLWTPSAGLNNPEAPNPIAAPSRTTRYVLTVTDALGCSTKDSISVNVFPGLEVDAGGSITACANIPTPLLAKVAGGSAPYRFLWSPALGLDNPSVQSPRLTPRSDAMYFVTVTDANGCFASDTVRVTVYSPPVVDAGNDLALCAGTFSQLEARVSGGKKPYSYEWNPRNGLSSAAVLTPEIRPEQSAVYVLTVRDGNGCVVSDSVLVTLHPQPVLKLAEDVTVCSGRSAPIGAQASGGSAPYRYRWSPSAGLDDATAATPQASPSRNTTYAVTVTDANGCTTGGNVSVTVQPRPELRYKDRHQICAGASAELSGSVRSGSPPFAYSWTPPLGLSNASIANPVANPQISATYTLRITDAAGCSDEQKVDVEVIAPPVAQAGEDVTLCDGTPTTLNGKASAGRPPYTILWSPADGLSSVRELSPTVRVSASRVYTLTVTDANGCVSTDEVSVFVAPSPEAHAGADVRMCAATSTPIGETATGGTPPYRYSWTPTFGLDNPNAMKPIASPNQTTEYTVTVTDARGCVDSDAISVFVYPRPIVSVPREMTICRDQGRRIELGISGGSGPYRYDWTPREGLSDGAAANPIANPIQTTTYTVTVTDANGCRVSAIITVTVQPCNKSDAGDDQDLCIGGELRIGPASVDTAYGARYSWSPETGLSSAKTAKPIARPVKSTTYVLSLRNRYECVSTDTVRINVWPVPSVEAGKDRGICPGGETELNAIAKGGQPPYQYEWEPREGIADVRSAVVKARPAGSTTYRVTLTDARGCRAVDSVRVNVSEPLQIAMARRMEVCEGQPTGIGGNITGGSTPYKIFWSPAGGVSNRSIATPVLTPVGSITYSVTVTDAEGCQLIDSVRVDMLRAPKVAIAADGSTDLCKGQSVALRAPTGFANYVWNSQKKGEIQRSISRKSKVVNDDQDVTFTLDLKGESVSISEAGEYTVTVVDGKGCTATSEPVSVRVFDLPQPRIVALGPLTFCEGDSVVLDAGKGFSAYKWSTGEAGRYCTARQAGTYFVRVTGEGGCEAEATPVSTFTRQMPIAALAQFHDTLRASESPRYQWFRDSKPLPGAAARMLVADRSGRYQVRTANETGCETMSEVRDLRFGSTTVSLPKLTARVGDTIDIPLRLVKPSGLDAAGAGTFTAVVTVKKKTLGIISGGVVLSETEDETRIRVDGQYRKGSSTLAVLRAAVLDGKRRITLELESLVWGEGLIRSKFSNGWLQLPR